MLSCKDASFMVSQSLDRKLTLPERLGLNIHLMMCNACRRMARQMELLHAVSLRYQAVAELEPATTQQTLSKEASHRILERLQQAARDH